MLQRHRAQPCVCCWPSGVGYQGGRRRRGRRQVVHTSSQTRGWAREASGIPSPSSNWLGWVGGSRGIKEKVHLPIYDVISLPHE